MMCPRNVILHPKYLLNGKDLSPLDGEVAVKQWNIHRKHSYKHKPLLQQVNKYVNIRVSDKSSVRANTLIIQTDEVDHTGRCAVGPIVFFYFLMSDPTPKEKVFGLKVTQV